MANDEHANWWLATCPETPHLITSTAPLPVSGENHLEDNWHGLPVLMREAQIQLKLRQWERV